MDAAAEWHEFYLLTGTAAATLAGLVFVALTLRPEVLDARTHPGARVLARQLFGNFVGVLLLSLIFLIPGQSAAALGTEITLAGALGLVTTLLRIRRVARPGAIRGPRLSTALGLAMQTLITAGGLAIFLDQPAGPFLAGLAIGAELVVAFVSTWQLVTE